MARISLPHDFVPRDYQKPIMKNIIEGKVKRAVCVWHRRAGKDKTFVNILAVMMAKRVGTYYYYFPTATLGRKIIWDGMDKEGMKFMDHFPSEFVKKVNNQEMKFTAVNGSVFQIIGTDKLDVVGTNPVGCLFSEASLQNPRAWDYVRPILAENGGWAIFNGTPRGKNWFYRLYEDAKKNPDWFAQKLTVEDTNAIPIDAVDAERRAGMREEMVQQEFYCDFNVGMSGSIYADAVGRAKKEGRVTEFKPTDDLVFTTWDLGSPENTSVIYWQKHGVTWRVIDHDKGLDVTIPKRVSIMLQKGYNYGYHALPHDAQRSMPTGSSYIEELSRAGLENCRIIPRTADPELRISKMLSLFPNIIFRESTTEKLLQGLESYRRKEDVKSGMITSTIVHDWASHDADAFGYFSEALESGIFGNNNRRGLPDAKPRVVKSGSFQSRIKNHRRIRVKMR